MKITSLFIMPGTGHAKQNMSEVLTAGSVQMMVLVGE